MYRRIASLLVGACLLAPAAALAQAPTWNSGYNGWWPGGFGFPPVTVKAPGYPACSVTAYGPTFHAPADAQGSWTQDYGAGTSCQGAIGMRALTVVDQVRGAQGRWWTIRGSLNSVGSATGFTPNTRRNPVHIRASREAVLGHTYRTLATAHLTVPNGFAGCSLHHPPACTERITAVAMSRPIAP